MMWLLSWRMTFSDKEKKLLERRRQGEALMIYGSQRAFMKVELTEEELRLIDPRSLPRKIQPWDSLNNRIIKSAWSWHQVRLTP